jgi:hypothetical protein
MLGHALCHLAADRLCHRELDALLLLVFKRLTLPANPACPPCLSLSADQLKELLLWWGGGQDTSGEGGSGEDSSAEGGKPDRRKEPQIEGLTGKMSFASQAKVDWIKAVLKQAEPNSTHAPGSGTWQQLRNTMPPAARALLEELASEGGGQPGVV